MKIIFLTLALALSFFTHPSFGADDWAACKPFCVIDANGKTATLISGYAPKTRVEMSIVSLETANKLFLQQKQNSKLPHEFVVDGAYARSYIMAYDMAKAGIMAGQVILAGNISYFSKEFGEIG